MDGCCSQGLSQAEQERIAKEEADMNREFSVNGVTLKIKDMFPDSWGARDFVSRLNLLEKTKGGKALMDTSIESMLEGDD